MSSAGLTGTAMRLGEERRLAVEVVVHECGVDARVARDPPQARLVISLGSKGASRRVDDRGARVRRRRGVGRAALCGGVLHAWAHALTLALPAVAAAVCRVARRSLERSASALPEQLLGLALARPLRPAGRGRAVLARRRRRDRRQLEEGPDELEVAHEGGLVKSGAAVDQGIDTDRGGGRDLGVAVAEAVCEREGLCERRTRGPAAQWSCALHHLSTDSAATPSARPTPHPPGVRARGRAAARGGCRRARTSGCRGPAGRWGRRRARAGAGEVAPGGCRGWRPGPDSPSPKRPVRAVNGGGQPLPEVAAVGVGAGVEQQRGARDADRACGTRE